jgi:cathepsin B
MKSVLILSLFVAIALCTTAVDHQFIQHINRQQKSWVAGENANFKGWTVSQAKRLLGWKPNGQKLPQIKHEKKVAIPDSWSAATQWPNCAVISTIYDQAECGSCWAFGCVEAVQDRFCIATNNSLGLSFMDEVCCDPNDDGCQGGDAGSAWQNVQSNGIVTSACAPYTVPTCPPSQEPCLNFVDTPNCPSSCSDSENWSQSKHYLSNVYSVSSDVGDIQQEMFQNGPIEACFSVYEDFLSYKTGVYYYTSGDFLGGHCVKCIGWGVDKTTGTAYWLCNNSWTTTWGDKGTFKIRRGTDECGIEDDVVGGTPNTQGL